ncbi:MAG: DUF721 domain-containing protein [Candidatus Hydrogenedentes bacterium]|nr:DUF721 domain-containing protein [Candidatus Hydrogenedentota bacterium]
MGVGEILDSLKKSTKLGKQLEQAQIWERWPEIAGQSLAIHGEPKTVRENKLYIEADSPVWMNEFAYDKWNIIKRVNRMSGHELISDIFITLRREKETKPNP